MVNGGSGLSGREVGEGGRVVAGCRAGRRVHDGGVRGPADQSGLAEGEGARIRN